MIAKIRAVVDKHQFVNFLIREIDGKYNKLKVRHSLSSKQKKEIDDYYEHLCGHKVPYSWHRFMYSRTGNFYKEYIPLSLYRSELIGRMNRYPFMDAYADKNVSDIIFPNVRQPQILLKNINGYYYSNGNPIAESDAIALCSNLHDMIIKPSLESRGVGVKVLTVENGRTNIDGMSIKELFRFYKRDFLIQERLKQHRDMAALNPSSINTIRLLTYRNDMDVIVLYTVVRIGKKGMTIDNESQGGISAKINENGSLAKYAYGAPGNDRVQRTDSGILIEGYKIPSYDKVVASAKLQHLNLPYFNIAAWDYCVSEDGDPILIEWNANPDLSQTANGPAFGKYTELIFRESYKNYNTRNVFW